LWRVKGPNGQPRDFRAGQSVQHGDVIRLEHVVTGRNLHSHHGFPSPVTGQQEVTCFGEDGFGDGNDDWRVDVIGGARWTTAEQLRLIHVSTDHALHSHAGYSHPDWTRGQQEVTCYVGRDLNDLWFASDLPENDAAFITQSVPSALLPGQGHDVSVTMRNVGSEPWTPTRGYRLGSQAPPDNQRWGLSRVELPGPVLPGQDATFSFHITALMLSARYSFQWRMLQEGIAWFGEPTPLVGLAVFQSQRTRVPDVVGMGRVEAALAIREADLVPRLTGPPGRLTEVVQQAPAAGTPVDRGATVTARLTSLV
jgi:hypothetical protein